MMKNKVNYFIISLLSLVTWSCVSEFNAELPSDDIDMLVVEGNIVANTQCIFYLEKSYSLNETKIPASSLDVRAELIVVGSSGYKSASATYLGVGKYQIDMGPLSDGQSYGIEINYDGEVYVSELLPPLATPEIDSVSWQQPEKNGEVSLHVSTHDMNNKTGFYKWSYVEDWEIRAAYQTSLFYDPQKAAYYEDDSYAFLYCWRKNVINPVLVGSSESLTENRIVNKELYERMSNDDRYSVLYSVNVVQQSLTKAGYEYYSNRAKLNDDMGGLFTPQPSEIRGNIVCRTNSDKKVMGFISVLKNVTEKRKYINSRDITRDARPNCEEIPQSDLSKYLMENKMNLTDLYNSGFRPVGFSMFSMGGDPSNYWVKEPCTDCTKSRGSKTKPDFWPNDHK